MERTHRIGSEGSLAETTYFCNDKKPHSSTNWKALFDFECTNSRGMGRVVRPVQGHAAVIEAILKDLQFGHVFFDISWDEVAKYLTSSLEAIRISANLINRCPDRLLFGTDEVATSTQEKYLKVYYQYDPIWRLLDKAAREKVRAGNYERIFDAARHRVRTWEAAHSK